MSIYQNSPFPQPVDGGEGTRINEIHEYVDYLPNTKMRIWYSMQNHFYPLHWHEAAEIIYCQSGSYVMGTEEREWTLQKGDILILPGGIPHSMDMKGECHGFVYLLDMELLNQIPSATLLKPLLSHPLFLDRSSSLIYQEVSAILEQIKTAYFGTNNLRELLVYSHFLMLLTKLGNYYLEESRKQTHLRADKQKEYMERFQTILNYINLHFAEDITLEQTARQFGLSKYHFSRLFYQYTTYHFSDYLNYIRIRAAESLLAQADMTVTQIASAVGFNTLSTFSRAFRQKNHCTPSEYSLLYTNEMPLQ